jgi:hypothetical protein
LVGAGVGIVALFAATVGVAIFLARGDAPFVPGVRVDVRNVDPQQSLHSVMVIVRGAQYSLGDLAPGETKSVCVNPTGESGVGIRHGETESAWAELNVDCYIEHNYTGSLQVDVTPTKIVKVNNQIGI